jgi:hypothetical protein
MKYLDLAMNAAETHSVQNIPISAFKKQLIR